MALLGASSDERIIAKVLAGERERYGDLVGRYLPVVQAVACARLGNTTDADDVAQETFLKAYQSLDQLRHRGKFGPWIAMIARNTAHRLMERRERERSAVASAPVDRATAMPDHARAEVRQALIAHVEQLEPETREAVLLVYFAGKNSRQAAVLLNTTHAAVRKRLERARHALGERLLADFGEAPAEDRSRVAQKILGVTMAAGAAGSAVDASAATAAIAVSAATWSGGAVAAALAGAATVVIGGGTILGLMNPASDSSTPSGPTVLQAAEQEAASDPPSPPEPSAADSPIEQGTALATWENPGGGERNTGPRMTGRILHSDGTPVADAVAFGAYWGRKPRVAPLEVRTGEDGSFEFHLDQTWEKFLIWAEKDGYVRIKQDTHPVPEDGLTGVDFTLYREGIIEGRLTSPAGIDVADKPVTAFNHDADGILWTRSARTDAGGAFRLTGLAPGRYDLAVVEERDFDRSLAALSLEVPEGATLRGVEVPYEGAGLVIAGRVVNREGAPLDRARVALRGGGGRSTTSDDEGRFRMENLNAGTHSLVVHRDHYQYAFAGLEAGTVDAEIVMRRLGMVSGRVVDGLTGLPIEEFNALSVDGETRSVNVGYERGFESFSDSDGRFTIAEVALDAATIVVRAEGYAPSYTIVRLSEEEHLEDLVVELTRGVTLTGRVENDRGDTVEGAYIILGPFSVPSDVDPDFYAQQTAEVARAVTDAEGAFELASLEEGSLLVSAYHPEWGLGRVEAYAPNDGPATIVLSSGGTVQGVVTLDGVPQEGCFTFLSAPGGFGNVGMPVHTERDGRFTLSSIPAGEYSAVTMLPGTDGSLGRRMLIDVQVSDGQTTEVVLDFPAEVGSVEGRVVFDGPAWEFGRVMARSATASREESQYVTVDHDGRFRVEGVPAGDVRLTAMLNFSGPPPGGGGHSVSRQAVATVQPNEVTNVTIAIEGSAALGGRVLGVEPGQRASVLVLEGDLTVERMDLAAMAALEPMSRGAGQVRDDGTYAVEWLGAGNYTVLAFVANTDGGPEMLESMRFATMPLRISHDETAQLDFDLR